MDRWLILGNWFESVLLIFAHLKLERLTEKVEQTWASSCALARFLLFTRLCSFLYRVHILCLGSLNKLEVFWWLRIAWLRFKEVPPKARSTWLLAAWTWYAIYDLYRVNRAVFRANWAIGLECDLSSSIIFRWFSFFLHLILHTEFHGIFIIKVLFVLSVYTIYFLFCDHKNLQIAIVSPVIAYSIFLALKCGLWHSCLLCTVRHILPSEAISEKIHTAISALTLASWGATLIGTVATRSLGDLLVTVNHIS